MGLVVAFGFLQLLSVLGDVGNPDVKLLSHCSVHVGDSDFCGLMFEPWLWLQGLFDGETCENNNEPSLSGVCDCFEHVAYSTCLYKDIDKTCCEDCGEGCYECAIRSNCREDEDKSFQECFLPNFLECLYPLECYSGDNCSGEYLGEGDLSSIDGKTEASCCSNGGKSYAYNRFGTCVPCNAQEKVCDDNVHWSSGFGDCDSYSEGRSNHAYCFDDAAFGLTAYEACPVACDACDKEFSPSGVGIDPSSSDQSSITETPIFISETSDYDVQECEDDTSWTSRFGDCGVFGVFPEKYFCDFELIDGVFGNSCPEACDACTKKEEPWDLRVLPTNDDPTWMTHYGNCSSYASDAANHQYCSVDKGGATLAADACSKACGRCEECKCSQQSCNDLGIDPFALGSPRSCGIEGHGEQEPCPGTRSFEEAEEYCESNGQRLCTLAEIIFGEMESTGCNYENHRMWTSSTLGCPENEYWTVSGSADFYDSHPMACRNKDSTYSIACCGDADLDNCCDEIVCEDDPNWTTTADDCESYATYNHEHCDEHYGGTILAADACIMSCSDADESDAQTAVEQTEHDTTEGDPVAQTTGQTTDQTVDQTTDQTTDQTADQTADQTTDQTQIDSSPISETQISTDSFCLFSQEMERSYLAGYACEHDDSIMHIGHTSLESAKSACCSCSECEGITQEPFFSAPTYSIRFGTEITRSHWEESSWQRIRTTGDELVPVCTEGAGISPGSLWVVCSTTEDTALLSSRRDAGGTFDLHAICKNLGYNLAGRWTDNCGNECGSCFSSFETSCHSVDVYIGNPNPIQGNVVWTCEM